MTTLSRSWWRHSKNSCTLRMRTSTWTVMPFFWRTRLGQMVVGFVTASSTESPRPHGTFALAKQTKRATSVTKTFVGEEAILRALSPDEAKRPSNLMDSDLFRLYAYVRCARSTYSLKDGCQVHLDVVHLGPDKYLLLATIIAPNLQALRSTKDRLVGGEAITVPTQSKVVCRIKHTSPELYQLLVDRGVVPKLPYWEGNVLSELPPGIDLGVPCPLECQVQMEKSAAELEIFYT